MSAATSPGTGLAYGLRRVCAAWGMARSSFYAMTSGQRRRRWSGARRRRRRLNSNDFAQVLKRFLGVRESGATSSNLVVRHYHTRYQNQKHRNDARNTYVKRDKRS